jgi:oxidase EvaA
MSNVSKEQSFLQSALVAESASFDNADFHDWFQARAKASAFSVRRIPFDEMEQWHFESEAQNLVHASGKFFRIEGLRVETNFENAGQWDQPIINQPEVGILGILSKQFEGVRHFLMQAKAEPGNLNTVQLSPTVQATRSNYSQVHGGRLPSYLEHFVNAPAHRILVDQLQTEQGSRFLQKQNRNMIVDVDTDEDVPVLDDFRWLTLGEIKQLQKIENFVNMDARSVISCVPFSDSSSPLAELPEANALSGFAADLLDSIDPTANAVSTTAFLREWIADMKRRFMLRTTSIPLAEVEHWTITEDEIRHDSEAHFSVIAVDVSAGSREVSRWTQPLLEDAAAGLHGFITQKHNGTLHFLVQAKVEPGNLDVIDLAPTVSRSNIELRRQRGEDCPFLAYFFDPEPARVRYSARQSEEGGRFFHLENENTILELEANEVLELPEHYTWMTLAQLLEFLKVGYLSVDARTLLACASLV